MKYERLIVGGVEIEPGTRQSLQIPISRRYSSEDVALPVCVIRGRRPGPKLFVSAAVHGDEINGVEIIRRMLKRKTLQRLRGTLIAVPVVNVYGFLAQTRYLPDRRDLNRCFPGSARGSLAGRLAHTFMKEIVANATHGIDLHTGALHRSNFPQIRASLDSAESEQLARSFGSPLILDMPEREGSLRQTLSELGIPMILYEAGEALRFDELAIKAGVQGVISVMRHLGMLPKARPKRRPVEPYVAHGSMWVRAPESGLLATTTTLGSRVEKGAHLGTVSDPLGEEAIRVKSPTAGVVIGRTRLPLVNEGDALFHIAVFERIDDVTEEVDFFQDVMDLDT